MFYDHSGHDPAKGASDGKVADQNANRGVAAKKVLDFKISKLVVLIGNNASNSLQVVTTL